MQSRKSRDTWSNSQIWLWSTKRSRAKANSFAKRTPSSNNIREDSTHGYHQMVNTEIRLIIFFAAKDGEALYSQQKTGMKADCGSNHELLIAKFRLKLKKVEKPLHYSGMT